MAALPLAVVALACPIGMGLVMWFMMRSMREHRGGSGHPAQAAASPEERLAQLEAEKRAVERAIQSAKGNSPAGGKTAFSQAANQERLKTS